MSSVYAEFEADRAAVADAGFCTLWATAAPILSTLSGLVKSSIVKIAITTVVAAGNAYCGISVSPTSQAKDRLVRAGLKGFDNLSPAQLTALEGMSDVELAALVKAQSAVHGTQLSDWSGSGIF